MLRALALLLALTFLPSAALAQSPAEQCDAYAGHPWEPGHNGSGVVWGAVVINPALEACRAALELDPDAPELKFRLARTLMQDQLYDEAMPLMFEAVAAGYPPAEAAYGTAFVKAQGVDPDYPSALYWLEKAAASGNVIGQNNLATMMLVGLGTRPDLDRAIALYRPAAEAGYAPAMFGLGVAYDRRSSSGTDLIAALDWFEKAADAGNIAAIAYVGRAYDRGIGVAADPAAAFRWYRTAAEAGNAAAQAELGLFYADGRGGIAENKPLAREWLGKAAAQLNSEAMYVLGRMLLIEPLEDDDTTEGVGWLERAAAQGEIEANALLGEYFARAGDTEKARQYAAVALRQGSEADKTYAAAVIDLAGKLDAEMGVSNSDALDPSSLSFVDPRAPRPLGQF
jgi:hypothetical protein